MSNFCNDFLYLQNFFHIVEIILLVLIIGHYFINNKLS